MVIQDYSLSLIRKIDQPGDKTTVLSDLVRRYTNWASVGLLRSALITAAKREGRRIVRHRGPSTFQCHACKAEHKPVKPSNLMHTCTHCGARWDRDVNAARNLYAIGADVLAGEAVVAPPAGDDSSRVLTRS